MEKRDLVIIGGGSAGLSAAVAAFDLGLKSILIIERGSRLGGILNQCIHTGFGLSTFNEQLTGPEYASRYMKMIEDRNIEYRLETNVLEISPDKIVTITSTAGLSQIEAGAIILATGCYERNAGAILLPGDRPRGILTAGQAQEYINIRGYSVGKRIFILGSGDIGLIMARRMTLEGAQVLGVAELMPYSNGLPRNIVQCLEDFNIPLFLSHTIKDVQSANGNLVGITIAQVDHNFQFIEGTDKHFDVDTLLLSIGLIPSNELLDNLHILASKTRGAVVDEHLQTGMAGVFSCGNCLHVHDVVDFVSQEGALAGRSAVKYLRHELKDGGDFIRVVAGNDIGYVVPQIIRYSDLDDEGVVLKYRPKRPLEKIKVLVSIDGKEIKKVFKPYAIPSEMEMIKLKKDDLVMGNELKVEVAA